MLVTGKGDSMIPTASTGKVVLVNTGTHSFESDGIYLVNLGHDQQIKHLQYQYGGDFLLSAISVLYNRLSSRSKGSGVSN